MSLTHTDLQALCREAWQRASAADRQRDTDGSSLYRLLACSLDSVDRHEEGRGRWVVPEPAEVRGLVR